MIRPTTPEDVPALIALTEATGVFKPHEITALQEVLDDYFEYEHENQHVGITYEAHGAILGFAYYAPTPMTERTWHLYWIAVSKQTQAKGIGGKLLTHIEETLRTEGARLLLIETSSLPHYELTRKFYLKNGYEQEATVRDYYAAGDDMVMFRKQF